MLTTLHAADARMREQIAVRDPFQLAPPLWRVRPFPFLPPLTINTIENIPKGVIFMPLKVVTPEQAPARLHARGTVSTKPEYSEVITWLRDPATAKNPTAIVTLNDAGWASVKKPETSFAYSLRRLFESKGIALTAYQSGKMEVTIRRKTAAEQSSGKGKK